MSLAAIVRDLMRNKSLRARFNVEPDTVIGEYGLDDAARAILLTMNPGVIAPAVPAYMRAEVQAFQVPNGELPACNENFLVEGGGADPQYPTPAPGIFRYRPKTISAAEINAKNVVTFEVVVFGQSFLDAELHLIRQGDNKEAVLTNPFVLGTYRCSIVRAVVSPVQGDNGKFRANDEFTIRIITSPNTANAANHDAGVRLKVLQ